MSLNDKTPVLGIDPGTTESGFVRIQQDYKIIYASKDGNEDVIKYLQTTDTPIEMVVIESIQSYGLTMGKSTIETCYFIGRIIQVCKDKNIPYELIPRPEYGKSIISGNKVNDSLIRSALEMRFGGYKKGEPLALLAGATDKRSAYAVACYYLDKVKNNV